MRPLLERLGGFLPAAIALALPTVFIPIAVDSYILPRAAIVVAGAGLGVGIALLLPGGPGLGPLRIPLIAAVAAALLAFAFSVSWPVSLIGSYTRYESLAIRLGYLGLLAAPVWLLRNVRSRDLVIPAFVAGSTIASLEALWQQQLLNSHMIDYRPDGNLGNANLLGALLAMAIPLAVARGLRRGQFRISWWLGVAVMTAGLVASTSRSGGLGALAGCLAVAVLGLKGRWAIGGSVVAGAVVGLALLAILFSPLRLLNDDPGPARLHLWPDAIRMIAARPVTGWGEDTTGLEFGHFLTGNWAPQVDRAHSGPLDIAATQGVIGLAALGWVLVTLVRAAWRWRFADSSWLQIAWLNRAWTWRSSDSIGALLAACLGYSVWVLFNFDWAPATGAFWLLAGTAWSGVRASEAEERSPTAGGQEPSPPRKNLRSVGALILAAAVVWFGALPVLADVWYYSSRLDLAVVADPLQGRYHWAYGKSLIATGSTNRGLSEMLLAASLGESDPQLYVDIGDTEQGLGHTVEARAAYRMALTIDPFFTPARQRMAGEGTASS